MRSSTGDQLKRAAAVPTRGLDLPRARRRGLIQRGIALAVATLGVAGVVALGTVAYPRIVDAFESENTAGPATDICKDAARPELTVFLMDDVTKPERRAMSDYLAARDGVASFDYVSKQEAFEEFPDIHEDQPEFWGPGPEVFPASFRLHLDADAPVYAINQELSGLPGVDEVRGPPPAWLIGARCDPPAVAICEPVEASDLEATIGPPKDGDEVDHFGIYLEVTVNAHDPACAPTIYIELDGTPMVPSGEGPGAGELTRAATDSGACLVADSVAGNLLYSGRHVVGIGTGCDPGEPGPYPIQRTLEFDGDAPVPSGDESEPRAFCDHARDLDELARPPTDEELDELVRSAPDEVRDDAALLAESARESAQGNDEFSMSDVVQEAADRFDAFVAAEC